jgi:hypothetical protein
VATKPKKTPARKPAPKKSKPAPRVKPAAVPKRKTKDVPVANPPAVDFTSPEYLAAYDAETARVGGEQVTEVYRLKAEWEEAHELAAGLKKQYEAHRTEHLAYVRDRIDKRGKNPGHLFAEAEAKETIAAHKKNGKAKPKGKGADLPDAPPAGGKAADWFPEEIWKQYPIDRLKGYGVTDADARALADCVVTKSKGETFPPVDTLGALVRFQEPKPNGFCWRVTDIKGIGPAAAERIANAITTFWADWPNLQQPFAVEKGHVRPDPLAEEKPADETAPRVGKKRRGKRDGSDGEPGPVGDALGAEPAADCGEVLPDTLTAKVIDCPAGEAEAEQVPQP